MVGLPPDRIEPARVEEVRGGGESPEAYVERLALEKAQAVAGREDGLVLAGDTVVVLDGQVLEKPDGRQGAVSMLLSLADREHTVWTGMAVALNGRAETLVANADVGFRAMSPAEAERYVDTGEPLDKAGGYGIQGFGSAFVSGVRGDYWAVVGFSVVGLRTLLRRIGLDLGFPGLIRLDGEGV